VGALSAQEISTGRREGAGLASKVRGEQGRNIPYCGSGVQANS